MTAPGFEKFRGHFNQAKALFIGSCCDARVSDHLPQMKIDCDHETCKKC